MIEILVFSILSTVDILKREIPPYTLFGAVLILIIPAAQRDELNYMGAAAGACLILFSLITGQSFGLADAIVLSVLSLRYGTVSMLMILFTADIMLLFFEFVRMIIKKRDKSLPFIPFISLSYFAINCMKILEGT